MMGEVAAEVDQVEVDQAVEVARAGETALMFVRWPVYL